MDLNGKPTAKNKKEGCLLNFSLLQCFFNWLSHITKHLIMKKIFITMAIIIVAVACQKTTSNQTSTISSKNIVATSKWELRKSNGSLAGIINYPAGNGQTIEFFATDSFKVVYPVSSVSPRDSGTYTIASTNTVGDYYLQKKYYRNNILYTDNDSIRIVNSQLVFLAHYGWADEPTLYYDKL